MSATLIQNRMPPGPLRRSSPQLFTSEEEQVFQIQHITLHRPKDGKGLGFTIRGGVEHGLGHFVSAIERGSEAHLQGLRPGDQILAVDGMMLTGATHREVVTLISSRWTLEISVKSTGVIPIKDRVGDPITWHNIAVRPEPPMNDVMKHLHTIPVESHVESRVVISITGSQGLGCSICKGPSSKPGIYIQSTKPGGLARQVGLRPGDQILDCNGISFQRLEFNEAVYHLKSSRHLDLLIRKGAGADLFPSESSGYDSSSSSSMGDSRPNPYRASVVIDTAKLSKSASDLSMSTKPTAVFTNRLRLEERVIEEERKKLEEEQERLKREAMRLEAEKKRFEEEKKLTTTQAKSKSSPDLNDSIDSSTESTLSGGLANQIQNELQRRAQKTTVTPTPASSALSVISVPLPPPPPKIPPQSNTNTMQKKAIQKEKTLANLKNDKHDALMEEFKRAHRRMFNSSTQEDEENQQHQEQHQRVIEDMNQMKEDTEYETQAIVTSVAVDLMPKPQEIKAVVKKEISFALEPKSTSDAVSIQSSTTTTTTTKSYCSDDTLSGSCSCSNTMSSSNPSNSSSCEESETTLSYIESEKPAKSTTPPFPPERSSSISPADKTNSPQPKTSSMLKKKKVPLSSFKPPLARKGHLNSPGIPTPDYDSTPERSPKSFKKRRYQNPRLRPC
ncbi:hypothetical protein TCAL_02784 [Tigriopus californicus]|uniref:PDZ domain-containing protein n=1 Tax=Tigriopus californicus TaxID=6832 RepID=A0A553NXM3_TIGCA|nr:hypothetical protein TCAL_02784 [Tigriopus californicus]|eukprot:TCALIF_02784-PA protein Name:"Similar to USH1C Harmonin (Homo sapiens)" AED:0.16 eAED:0.18 QI:0/-1/0/1/-1/1/1/0/673